MKKFSIFLVIILTLVLCNYGFWFWQTTIIKRLLENFRQELAINNILLKYDDISFSNFKSWRIEGRLHNLSFETHNKIITFERIGFKAYPMNYTLLLKADKNIYYIPHTEATDVQKYIFKYAPEASPYVSFQFSDSLSKISELYKNHDTPKLKIIKKMIYNSTGFEIIDTKLNIDVATIGLNFIEIEVLKEEKYKKEVSFNIGAQNVNVSSEYLKQIPSNPFINLYNDMGGMSYHYKFNFIEKPSKAIMDNYKVGKSKLIYDSYQFNFDKLSFKNNLSELIVKGTIEKEPDVLFPEIDLTISIDNYKNCLMYMLSFYNSVVEKLQTENIINFGKIDAQKLQAMGDLVVKKNEEKDYAEISIINKRDVGFFVSGKSGALILQDMQKILKEQSAPPQLTEQK